MILEILTFILLVSTILPIYFNSLSSAAALPKVIISVIGAMQQVFPL
mgnify:CR=1 FL=1